MGSKRTRLTIEFAALDRWQNKASKHKNTMYLSEQQLENSNDKKRTNYILSNPY